VTASPPRNAVELRRETLAPTLLNASATKETAMKKQNKTKLALNKETIKALDRKQLADVAGAGYTCGGTMCESCSYRSAISKCLTVIMEA
jgi:hypothetical protein